MKKLKSNFVTLFKTHWFFVFIILVAVFLRMYHGIGRYSLGYESIRDFVVAQYGATQFQLPLSGPFSSLGSFTFGPWYWYLLILSEFLIPSAYAPWMIMSICSVGFVIFMYLIGIELKDLYLGNVLALLATINVYLISSSTALSNPNPVAFMAAGALYCFLRVIKKDAHWWWSFGLSFFVGIGFFSHYQMLAYLIFPPTVILLKKFQWKHFLANFFGMLLAYGPMLIFDLINRWYMVRNIWFAFTDMGNRIYVPNSWKLYLFDFWPHAWSSFWGVPEKSAIPIVFLIAAVCLWSIVRKKWHWKTILVTLLFAIIFVHLRYYKGERFMGYIHYLFPFLVLYPGLAISSLRELKRGFAVYWFVVCILFVGGVVKAAPLTKQQPYPSTFDQLGKWYAQNYPGQKFSTYYCAGSGNEDDILSLTFILHKEGMLEKGAQPITSLNNTCLQKVAPDEYQKIDKPEYEAFLHDQYLLDSTLDFEALGYDEYTLDNLYKKYALWWFEPNID